MDPGEHNQALRVGENNLCMQLRLFRCAKNTGLDSESVPRRAQRVEDRSAVSNITETDDNALLEPMESVPRPMKVKDDPGPNKHQRKLWEQITRN